MTLATAIVCVAIGLYIGLYLTNVPGSQAATRGPSGVTNLYLGTVPAAELTDPHPTWVSYYVVNAASTSWKHDTTFVLPANSLVHVTIYQFDGGLGPAQPVHLPGHGHGWRGVPAQREADGDDRSR